MPLIPREKIDEVRDRTSIVEVIKRYVELKRAGTGSWKGLCPFHGEKSPSFHVHEQRQYFYCFGCHEKGDVFKFLEKIEQRSFMEILRDLSQSAGIDLPERSMTAAESRAQKEAESEKERMLRMVERAVRFFEDTYAGPSGTPARAYVEGRGIGARVRERFHVGYAPEEWHSLETELGRDKLPMAEAERLGLVRAKDGRRYDFFRGRVMLPVIDHRTKRPVGFSSRVLDPDAKEAKYINSPESPLFSKKRELYGLHAAQEAIRKSGTAIVVEGNFDVLTLHEAGIEEAVAPMGTALTPEQVALLGRMAARVVVVFDGDAAGVRAAQKAVPLFVEADVDGRIARLPSGVDPDDFVRAEGAAAFRKLVDSARPAVEQMIDDLAAHTERTIPGRVRALEEAAPILAKVKNATARELYAGRLATTLGLDARQVARAVRTAAAGERVVRGAEAPREADTLGAGDAREPARDELEVLVLLAAHPSIAAQVQTDGVADLLVDPGVRALLRAGLAQLATAGRLDVPAWLDAGPADVRSAVARAMCDGRYADAEAPARVLAALATRLRRLRIDAEIAMMKRQKNDALARGDEATARAIGIRELELIRTKQGLSGAPQRQ